MLEKLLSYLKNKLSMQILAGTGHRPKDLGGYSDQIFNKMVDIASNYLSTLEYQPTIISGMALGWDQALAKAAMNLSLPLWAYIPFVDQASVWPLKSRAFYYFLLEYSSRKVICSTGEYSALKMQIRNERMVDDSDIILALYNGKQYGGTFNCIQYAISKNKPIVNLYNKFQ